MSPPFCPVSSKVPREHKYGSGGSQNNLDSRQNDQSLMLTMTMADLRERVSLVVGKDDPLLGVLGGGRTEAGSAGVRHRGRGRRRASGTAAVAGAAQEVGGGRRGAVRQQQLVVAVHRGQGTHFPATTNNIHAIYYHCSTLHCCVKAEIKRTSWMSVRKHVKYE